MWTNLERSIDGVVGRMLSWWSHPPMRPLTDRETVSRDVVAGADAVVETAVAVETDAAVEAVATPSQPSPAKSKRRASRSKTHSTKTTRQKATRSKRPVTSRPKKRAQSKAIDKAAPERKTESGKMKPARARSKVTETAKSVAETAKSVAQTTKSVAESDELETKIVAALDVAEDGLAMKQLVSQTAGERPAIRQRLKKLSAAGRIQRKGEGMRTRYYAMAAE